MMIRRSSGWFVLFLLACRLAAFSQAGDTIVVGGEDAGRKTHIDTSFAAAPESSGQPDPVEQPVLRRLPDTLVYRWQQDPKYAYANDPEYWKLRSQQPGSFNLWFFRVLNSKAFRYTMLTLLAALLLYAIVRIMMDNNLGPFYRRAARGPAAEGEAGVLPQQEDIDQQLQHYLQLGDKRQATRYLYLKGLQLLSDRNLIRRHADTTNQEYLRQLKGTPAEAAFRFLTGAYEWVWYGDFQLSEASFQRLYAYFMDFFKTLEA
jgi:hypothetical protein